MSLFLFAAFMVLAAIDARRAAYSRGVHLARHLLVTAVYLAGSAYFLTH